MNYLIFFLVSYNYIATMNSETIFVIVSPLGAMCFLFLVRLFNFIISLSYRRLGITKCSHYES